MNIHGRALISEECPRVKDPEFYSGGGGLYSPAHDYLTFLQMIMHRGTANGTPILRSESVALTSENQIGKLSLPKLWKTTVPRPSNDVDFSTGFPDQDLKWSLSFMTNTRPGAAGASTGSLFWAELANPFYWLDPTRRVSRAFLDPPWERSLAALTIIHVRCDLERYAVVSL